MNVFLSAPHGVLGFMKWDIRGKTTEMLIYIPFAYRAVAMVLW